MGLARQVTTAQVCWTFHSRHCWLGIVLTWDRRLAPLLPQNCTKTHAQDLGRLGSFVPMAGTIRMTEIPIMFTSAPASVHGMAFDQETARMIVWAMDRL